MPSTNWRRGESGDGRSPTWYNQSVRRNRSYVQENQRWMELCALAAEEQDSDKLLELTQEINKLLAEKERRLKQKRS